MEKRTLAHMLKSMKLDEEKSNIKFPISGLFIISAMVEAQNKALLIKIANKKFSDRDEREHFIEQFLKVSYHVPEIAENENQERLQKYLL
jgi:hypothetical protein|tara:strand:- start:267 stop:536 length:270 start_codon:yes stop_codon:yes gene_type:complete